MALLEVTDLDAYYGESHILRDVSLSVDDGSVVMVAGRNGVGKTTLIRSLMNLQPPQTTGTVVFDNTDISSLPTFEINQRGIGLVPQERRVWGSLTVDQNLKLPMTAVESPRYTPDDVYDIFPPLVKLQDAKARNLSGGEQQMVSIGRGLIGDTKLLLLDEPLEGLAPTIVESLKDVIADLKAELTMVIIEQSISDAMEMADYGYVIDRGMIAFEGSMDSFEENRERVRKLVSV